jgi:flagellar hook-length control protein FliK
MEKVRFMSGKTTQELHVSLKPEELGRISIRLVMEKGVMTGRIVVENSQVKELMESGLPQIKESLKSQNLDVSSFSVSVDLGQGSLQQNQGFRGSRWMENGRGRYTSGAVLAEAVPTESYGGYEGLNLLA